MTKEMGAVAPIFCNSRGNSKPSAASVHLFTNRSAHEWALSLLPWLGDISSGRVRQYPVHPAKQFAPNILNYVIVLEFSSLDGSRSGGVFFASIKPLVTV